MRYIVLWFLLWFYSVGIFIAGYDILSDCSSAPLFSTVEMVCTFDSGLFMSLLLTLLISELNDSFLSKSIRKMFKKYVEYRQDHKKDDNSDDRPPVGY